MDKRTKVYFRLFLMRFRKNYYYFLNNYRGRNIQLYREQLVQDNLKLAQALFGDEGMREMKKYVNNLRVEPAPVRR